LAFGEGPDGVGFVEEAAGASGSVAGVAGVVDDEVVCDAG
jgi:hypothetical protein